jgi:HAD superfamily hydrolase (TIGR01509 family)
MSSQIKAVIFDIGGILAYDVWEHLYLDDVTGLASRFNLPKDKAEEVGKKLWKEFAHISMVGEETPEMLEQKYWQRFIDECGDALPAVTVDELVGLSDSFIRDVNNAEMIPLLEAIKDRGLVFAICSNNNEFWFKRQMHKLGFATFFPDETTILSCRIGVSKDDPSGKMFTEVLEKLALPPEETLYFEDRKSNVERAQAYGINAILVPPESAQGASVITNALTSYGISL